MILLGGGHIRTACSHPITGTLQSRYPLGDRRCTLLWIVRTSCNPCSPRPSGTSLREHLVCGTRLNDDVRGYHRRRNRTPHPRGVQTPVEPDGVEDWTSVGKHSLVLRRLLGQREVWVETPVHHFSVTANAMKMDKGRNDQSYYYEDLGG